MDPSTESYAKHRHVFYAIKLTQLTESATTNHQVYSNKLEPWVKTRSKKGQISNLTTKEMFHAIKTERCARGYAISLQSGSSQI